MSYLVVMNSSGKLSNYFLPDLVKVRRKGTKWFGSIYYDIRLFTLCKLPDITIKVNSTHFFIKPTAHIAESLLVCVESCRADIIGGGRCENVDGVVPAGF